MLTISKLLHYSTYSQTLTKLQAEPTETQLKQQNWPAEFNLSNFGLKLGHLICNPLPETFE